MTWLLDGIVVLIIIISAIIGYIRGFFKYAVCLLGTICAVLLSLFIADMTAQNVYNKMVKTKLTTSISQAVTKADIPSKIREELSNEGLAVNVENDDLKKIFDGTANYADNMKALLLSKGATEVSAQNAVNNFSTYISSNRWQLIAESIDGSADANSGNAYSINGLDSVSDEVENTILSKLVSQSPDTAQYIEENVLRQMLVPFVKIAVFVVCYIIFSVIIRLIIFLTGINRKMPEMSAANRVGGLAIGLAKGIMYCMLIAFLFTSVVNSTSDSMQFFNSKTADNTLIFRYLFDIFFKHIN